MKVDDVIESYVRDVAACLPRARRDDVAFELRALLAEELAHRAEAAGRAPDSAMAMALLGAFGRPADVAQRYHARPALIEPADTHHFLIWALGGAVMVGMHSALGNEIDRSAVFVQWLGILSLFFALAGWWRRRRGDTFSWKPRRGPEWMPRWQAGLLTAALLVFPVAMYAAPLAYARWLLPDAVPVTGLALFNAFEGSGLRMATLGALVLLAMQYLIALVLGARPRWLRMVGVAVSLVAGVLLIAHGAETVQVFVSAVANAKATPWFLATGGMMVLVCVVPWLSRMGVDQACARVCATGTGVSGRARGWCMAVLNFPLNPRAAPA